MRNTAKNLRQRVQLIAKHTGRDLTLDSAYGKYRLMLRHPDTGGTWLSDRMSATHMGLFLDGMEMNL